MNCYKCDSDIKDGTRFCVKCGFEQMEDLVYLDENERKELIVLDDPNLKYFSSPFNFWASFFANKSANNRNKKRVVELMVKMRMKKDGFDVAGNKKELQRIKEEEERAYVERHKK